MGDLVDSRGLRYGWTPSAPTGPPHAYSRVPECGVAYVCMKRAEQNVDAAPPFKL